MNNIVTGKVFVFGKNIDTDQIYPGRFVEQTDVEEVAKHAMEGADPDFVKVFKKGDIIAASTNFGCGSSREHAAIALKVIGAGAILAESFGRIFYRNAINLGVPVIVCPGITEWVCQGDTVCVDIVSGLVTNTISGKTLQAQPLSEYTMNILASGGIKPMIKNIIGKKK